MRVSHEFSPYKGLAPYAAEDSQFFHGRDAESAHVVQLILSNRLSVMHARSGAGKSSLLNAEVLGKLEQKGAWPIRIELENDPLGSVYVRTLHYMMPPPPLELVTLEKAAIRLGLDSDATLADLLRRHGELSEEDPLAARELVKPHTPEEDPTGGMLPFQLEITPYLARLLRRTTAPARFHEYLSFLRQVAPAERESEKAAILGRRLGELGDKLESDEAQAHYKDRLADLYSLYASGDRLSPFLNNIAAAWATTGRPRPIVLVFDQFEEIFTRYVPKREGEVQSPDAPDFGLRELLFRNLEEIHLSGEGRRSARGDGDRQAPVRIVFALRSDYYGQLSRIRSFAPDYANASYHLQALRSPQATAAIRAPAELVGFEHRNLPSLLKGLVDEEGYVEPAHLQLACGRLWTLAVKRQERAMDAADLGKQGVRGVLKSFLGEVLDELTKPERLEAVDILTSLITPSDTRDLVERSSLVNVAGRMTQRREEVLELLIERRLVRAQQRLGGTFVEITHEFLVSPVREAEQREELADPLYADLRRAHKYLETTMARRGGTFSRDEFQMVQDHAAAIWWSQPAAALMLRSALLAAEGRSDVRLWVRGYLMDDPVRIQDLLHARRSGAAPLSAPLGPAEVRWINDRRAEIPDDPQRDRQMLQSLLLMASDEDVEPLRYWARQVRDGG